MLKWNIVFTILNLWKQLTILKFIIKFYFYLLFSLIYYSFLIIILFFILIRVLLEFG